MAFNKDDREAILSTASALRELRGRDFDREEVHIAATLNALRGIEAQLDRIATALETSSLEDHAAAISTTLHTVAQEGLPR